MILKESVKFLSRMFAGDHKRWTEASSTATIGDTCYCGICVAAAQHAAGYATVTLDQVRSLEQVLACVWRVWLQTDGYVNTWGNWHQKNRTGEVWLACKNTGFFWRFEILVSLVSGERMVNCNLMHAAEANRPQPLRQIICTSVWIVKLLYFLFLSSEDLHRYLFFVLSCSVSAHVKHAVMNYNDTICKMCQTDATSKAPHRQM